VAVLRIGSRGSLLGEGAVKDLLEAVRKRQLEQVFFGCNVFQQVRTGMSMKQRAVVTKGMLEESGTEDQVRKLEEEWKENVERKEMMVASEQVRQMAVAGCCGAVFKDVLIERPILLEGGREGNAGGDLGARQDWEAGKVLLREQGPPTGAAHGKGEGTGWEEKESERLGGGRQ